MYEFFDRDGVEHVRINVGIDTVERVATEADHAAADAANAAEEAAVAANEAATAERVERENANQQATQEQFAAERARLDEEKARNSPGYQRNLEQEFDQGLEHELGKKSHKHA